MKVTIKEWNAVASWRWDMPEDDVCGICRVQFDGTCPTCKYPGDDCTLRMCFPFHKDYPFTQYWGNGCEGKAYIDLFLVIGKCGHSFHMVSMRERFGCLGESHGWFFGPGENSIVSLRGFSKIRQRGCVLCVGRVWNSSPSGSCRWCFLPRCLLRFSGRVWVEAKWRMTIPKMSNLVEPLRCGSRAFGFASLWFLASTFIPVSASLLPLVSFVLRKLHLIDDSVGRKFRTSRSPSSFLVFYIFNHHDHPSLVDGPFNYEKVTPARNNSTDHIRNID